MDNMEEFLKKHQIKVSWWGIITLVIWAILSTAWLINIKNSVDNSINRLETGMEHTSNSIDSLNIRVTANEQKGNQQDVVLERILTKLDNIEKLLTQ